MSLVGLIFPFAKGSKGIAPQKRWTQDQGVDIAAPGGTKLVAVGTGTVVRKGISGFGPTAPVIRLDTPISGHRYVYYGHTGSVFVNVGDRVKAGQVIAEVGRGIVGISTGPHLELGLADTPGPAARGATSSDTLGALKTAQKASASFDVATSGGTDAQTGGVAAVGPQLGLEQKIAQAVLGSLWDAIGENALRVLLYLLFVFGGLALGFAGVKQLTRQEAPRA